MELLLEVAEKPTDTTLIGALIFHITAVERQIDTSCEDADDIAKIFAEKLDNSLLKIIQTEDKLYSECVEFNWELIRLEDGSLKAFFFLSAISLAADIVTLGLYVEAMEGNKVITVEENTVYTCIVTSTFAFKNSHLVKYGESLTTIASTYYPCGDLVSQRMVEVVLYELNKQSFGSSPDDVTAGKLLVLPDYKDITDLYLQFKK